MTDKIYHSLRQLESAYRLLSLLQKEHQKECTSVRTTESNDGTLSYSLQTALTELRHVGSHNNNSLKASLMVWCVLAYCNALHACSMWQFAVRVTMNMLMLLWRFMRMYSILHFSCWQRNRPTLLNKILFHTFSANLAHTATHAKNRR